MRAEREIRRERNRESMREAIKGEKCTESAVYLLSAKVNQWEHLPLTLTTAQREEWRKRLTVRRWPTEKMQRLRGGGA